MAGRATPIIRAQRLDLVTLTPQALSLSLARDAASVEERLGGSVPPEWFEEAELIRFRLEQVRQDPAYLPWSVRAIVLRAARQMVGYIGCHTRPGHPYLKEHAPEGVEFGFEVFAPFRRRGFAREACGALMDWAEQQHGITVFVVSISPDNEPSLRLAASLGFEHVGSHIDDVDGLENVFRLDRRRAESAQ